MLAGFINKSSISVVAVDRRVGLLFLDCGFAAQHFDVFIEQSA